MDTRMGCSEPVLTKDGTGLIDNFFVYLIDKRAGTASGPLARMGLHAESGALAYLTSADERPFSALPGDTVPVNSPVVSNKDYENYSALYAEVREFAFKRIPSSNHLLLWKQRFLRLETVLVFTRPRFWELFSKAETR